MLYIPDRYKEGYGVSFEGIDFAHKKNVSLIIALDCGIKATDKIAYANTKNIDCIVCDHHTPGESIPLALAVLNPKQKDCDYPYKELCGCAVGFKLVQALQKKEGRPFKAIAFLLDLVALATAADIVPIEGENRILTYYGLKVINQNPRTGIAILKKDLKNQTLNVRDLVFGIAPKINAAARMEHGLEATKILLESDAAVAASLAKEIAHYNTQRKNIDKKITQEALDQIQNQNMQNACSTVVYDAHWHKGVIGIVASRLIERYYRPTVVFTKSGKYLVGSARSVKGFDLYECLSKCSAHIEKFGGHKFAAGLSVAIADYKKFKNTFEQVVAETLPEQLKAPEVVINATIALKEITPKFYNILKQMAPFGPCNMRPVFLCENLKDTGWARRIGAGGEHLKLRVYQNDAIQNSFDAIGFGLGDKIELVKNQKKFHGVFCVSENTWQGKTNLQLELKHIY